MLVHPKVCPYCGTQGCQDPGQGYPFWVWFRATSRRVAYNVLPRWARRWWDTHLEYPDVTE